MNADLRRGSVLIAVALVLLFWAFMHHLPFAGGPHGAVVRAEVRTAANVSSRTPVRVGGTDVGSVERLERAGGGRTTTIVMRITKTGVRVSEDAQADVRYRTLLGGSMYIDLDPGSPSAPRLGDRTIPLARTSAQVDWDEFNGIWAKPVPQGERRVVKGFADALEDPAALRTFLRAGGPALRSFGRAARAARGQRGGDLPALVREAARATRAFAGDGRSLDNLIRGAQRMTAATARARAALGDTLDRAPVALRSARTTMARLDGTLTRLDPLADELTAPARAAGPATRRLRPALESTDRLMLDARPLLAITPSTLDAVHGTARSGLPFLDALRTMSARVVADLLPWLNREDPKSGLKLYEEIGPWLSGQDDSYSNFDDNGYFLRAVSHQSPNSAVIPCSPSGARCTLLRRVMAKALEAKR